MTLLLSLPEDRETCTVHQVLQTAEVCAVISWIFGELRHRITLFRCQEEEFVIAECQSETD